MLGFQELFAALAPACDLEQALAASHAALERPRLQLTNQRSQRTEDKVRASAAEALVRIGPGPVVPSMIEALRNAEAAVRANAAVVLGACGPAAKSAVPALRDANPRVRELAGEALNRIASTGSNLPASFLLNCH